MKILFFSVWGSSVPLAMACEDQGHDVLFFLKEKSDVGDGFVNKTEDYEGSCAWADLIIFDWVGDGDKVDKLRAKGKAVIGGSEKMDKIEKDRALGQKLFKASGMEVLESKDFKSIEEAMQYVQDNPKRYVIKVSGNQDDKSMTYVGEADNGMDIPPVLEHMEKKMKGISSVEIQEHVEGLEVAVNGFFNGKEFKNPVCNNFEHKKMMPGPTPTGTGPNTGEMGTIQLWMNKEDLPIYAKTIGLMEKALAQLDYRGDYDINCIVKDGIVYPLEATCRFGWPTLPMQLDSMKGQDLGELFLGMANGTKDSFEVDGSYNACVVVGVPPLPYMNKEILAQYSKDMPILFKDPYDVDGIYPGEAKLEDDQWLVSGSDDCSGNVIVCAGRGETLDEAIEMAYHYEQNVIVANKIVRNDIGEHVHKMLLDLMDLGLLGEVEDAVGE